MRVAALSLKSFERDCLDGGTASCDARQRQPEHSVCRKRVDVFSWERSRVEFKDSLIELIAGLFFNRLDDAFVMIRLLTFF